MKNPPKKTQQGILHQTRMGQHSSHKTQQLVSWLPKLLKTWPSINFAVIKFKSSFYFFSWNGEMFQFQHLRLFIFYLGLWDLQVIAFCFYLHFKHHLRKMWKVLIYTDRLLSVWPWHLNQRLSPNHYNADTPCQTTMTKRERKHNQYSFILSQNKRKKKKKVWVQIKMKSLRNKVIPKNFTSNTTNQPMYPHFFSEQIYLQPLFSCC